MTTEFNEINGRWNYNDLPENISIGDQCWLERKQSFERFRSRQKSGLIIGDQVRVYTWSTFNVDEEGIVEIGDESILVGAIFMCAERISVGKHVVISYNVTIADSDFHPIDPVARKQDAIANAPFGNKDQRPHVISKAVVIEDDVWIGIGSIILKGVTIGKGARVCAGSIVTADVPPGATVMGNPARTVEKDV